MTVDGLFIAIIVVSHLPFITLLEISTLKRLTVSEQNVFRILRDVNEKYQKKINKQRKYFLKRGIPKDMVDTFYYCIEERYLDRVIIPFYDEQKRIYYFQARATSDFQSPKYINWRDLNEEESTSKPEYNEYHVDKTKTVYIVEGLIDSFFLENAVSTLGANMSIDRISYYVEKYPKCAFVLDNDDAGWKTTMTLLRNNQKCFIIPTEFRKFKDLNDIALEMGERNLTEFIKNNTYQGVKGLVKLKERDIIIQNTFTNDNNKSGGTHELFDKIKRIGRDDYSR
jgi:DNA primase